jgi:hypothetical protein
MLDRRKDEPSDSKLWTLKSILHASLVRLKSECHDFGLLAGSSRNIGLCLAVFLVTTLAKSNMNVLLQYVSMRYQLDFKYAAYLFSLKALVIVALYAGIIPFCLRILTSNPEYTKATANLWGAKGSLSLLCLGVVAIALSPTIWILIPSTSPHPLYLTWPS